ncbi:MAG: hypothetical protein Q9175_007891 [Cornicularia normoerica]
MPFKIYERSLSHDLRFQGYRIRLHGDGLNALRSVLTDEVWDLFEETCPETVLEPLPNINAVTCEVIAANYGGNDPQGKLVHSAQKPYTADRAVLRQVLLTGLDQYIIYGIEYTHYSLTDLGITAHFADGTRETGSLLIGADGVRSVVRRQHLPHLRVLDTKSRPIFGKTPLTPSLESHILPKVMECLSLIKDSQTSSVTLMEVIRFLPKDRRRDKRDLPNDYVYWVITPSATNVAIPDKQFDHLSKEAAAELSKALTAHWHPSLRPLIEDQDPSQTGVFRLLSSDPKSLMRSWEPNGRVTLMGDAAHAIMPSTASGAVTALRDAQNLVRLIREHGVGKESIERYEEDMRKYASEAVAISAKIGEMSFGLGALADAEEVVW